MTSDIYLENSGKIVKLDKTNSAVSRKVQYFAEFSGMEK